MIYKHLGEVNDTPYSAESFRFEGNGVEAFFMRSRLLTSINP